VIFATGLATFNDLVYGGVLRSGYQPGEITFALDAIWPNLRLLPMQLLESMPMLLAALLSIGGVSVMAIREWRTSERASAVVRRDVGVVAAMALCWLAIWGLYLTYTWTTDPTNAAVSNVRFYVPALGPIAILGSWLVTRIPGAARRPAAATTVLIAGMFGLGVWSFHVLYNGLFISLHGL
jgi:hypothetical protein